jgi:ABC-type nitrate/sulfonate/bicarbonate transport system permease component
VKAYITPNAPISEQQMVRMGWLGLAALIWILFKPAIMPNPLDIILSIPNLWNDGGLRDALITSFVTNVQAIVVSAAISLPLAWLSRVPIIRPLAEGIAKLRFLSPAIFFIILLFMLGSPHAVKIAMLVLGESFFLMTSMVNVVQGIPASSFDEATVLRMSPWQSTWYVVVRGTLHQALEAIRDNTAMGWSMLMMVEGFLRSEGGIGVLMLNQERYMKFDNVYGIALSVLVVGIGQDLGLRWLRGALCPHTKL